MIQLMYRNYIKPLLADLGKLALDTLFPVKCLSCGKESEFICACCQAGLKQTGSQLCIVCQQPAPGGLTHPKCRTPLVADGLVSFFDYHDDKIAKIIIDSKYFFLPKAFESLGLMLAEKIKAGYPALLEPNLPTLVPIPLYPSRRRWRGFNQAEILAQAIGQRLGLPYAGALVRRKPTKTQKDLNRDQRKQNMENAFALSPSFTQRVRGNSFILIDDVATTGSTLLEAAKVLKRNGAESVWCLTVAKD